MALTLPTLPLHGVVSNEPAISPGPLQTYPFETAQSQYQVPVPERRAGPARAESACPGLRLRRPFAADTHWARHGRPSILRSSARQHEPVTPICNEANPQHHEELESGQVREAPRDKESTKGELEYSRAGTDAALRLISWPRFPGRLNTEQAAAILGFGDHDIPVLVTAKHFKPLGNPVPNAVNYFAAKSVEGFAEDEEWLSRATKATYAHWARQNTKRNDGQGVREIPTALTE